MAGAYDEAWLIDNVDTLRGDADRWPYSDQYEALYERYVGECDRRMDRRRLCLKLIDMRKQRHKNRPAGRAHLPEAVCEEHLSLDLTLEQERHLIDLYVSQDRNDRELIYSCEFDRMHDAYCEV